MQPLSPVKAAVVLEAGGWQASGAVFARGQDVAVVADGVMRIVPAARWAEFMAPAKWGTLGTVEASAPAEESEGDEDQEAWLAEMALLCKCDGPTCGGVLAGGPCDSEDADD